MIEEIKRIFDDIAKAIIEMGGTIDECTSPEDYAEAIKNLSGNNAVLFVPVFRSSDIKPDTPTTPLDISNPGPDAYPDGGSTPNGLEGNIWMSYTIVSASQIYVPGTEPILIKTVNDEVPSTYDDATTRTFTICLELPSLEIEPLKPTGGRGVLGEDDNRLDASTIVSTLKKNGNVIGTTSDFGYNWTDENNHVDGMFTWIATGTFLAETGELVGKWSDPFCINSAKDGKDGLPGRNGTDGQSQEYIYKLCADENTARAIIADGAPESNPDQDDDIPGPDPNTRGNWCDHPMGIDSEEYRVEIMCTRKKNDDGKGGDFQGPIIWSIGGEEGIDGDGIEYIFRIAGPDDIIIETDAEGEENITLKSDYGPPTCEEDCGHGFLNVAKNGIGYISDEEALEAYQKDEFVPGNDIICPDAARLGWDFNGTDDPENVKASKPYQFCSIRRYKGDEDAGKQQWQWFSKPVLWNRYYIAAAPLFTSIVFCRSTQKLGGLPLTGGTMDNPVPDTQTYPVSGGEEIKWYRYVPGYDEYANDPDKTRFKAPVGMASAIFGSTDPTRSSEPDGNGPMLQSDSKYFNVEWSASEFVSKSTVLPKFDATFDNGSTYPFIDPNDPEGVNESAGRQYCRTHDASGNVVVEGSDTSLGVGGDTDDTDNPIVNPKGRAECRFEDGKWTSGTITQIDAKDGLPGLPGDPGRGIVSTSTYYMWSADGTNHPAESASGGSTSVPIFSANTPYLWCKIVITYDSGNPDITYSVSRQGSDGDRGSNGSKMRMRNGATNYSNPDPDGQIGGLTGNDKDSQGNGDAFYDIAIYPVTGDKITQASAASNAPKLGLCKKRLTYTNLATIISNAGSANLVYPGSTYLAEYFVQAEGGDFVATNVLLAHKISADDIEVAGLYAQELHTVPTPTHPDTLDISGNEISLNNNGQTRCKISADDLDTQVVSSNTETIGDTKIVDKTIGGSLDSTNYVIHTEYLGSFNIRSNGASDFDLLKSAAAQTFRVEFTGTLNSGRTNIPVKYEYEIELYARDQYGNVTNTGYQMGPSGYTTLGTINGELGQTFDINGDLITLDTTEDVNAQNKFAPGRYSLYLDVTLSLEIDGTQSMPSYIDDAKLYLNQVTFSPFIVKHRVTTNTVPITEIGANGFQFMIDDNNYFRVRIAPSNEGYTANSILIECVSNDTYGLQISSKGVKKYNAQTHDGDIDL